MKKILLIGVFITLALSCFSQDYLLLRDGTEKDVVVLEITPDVVKYRRYNSNSKTVYSIDKTDVRKIIFEDGEEEVFSSTRNRRESNDYYTNNRVSSNVISRGRYDNYYDDYEDWGYSEPKFLIGIKGGLNISKISGTSELSRMSGLDFSSGSLLGFHIGLAAQINSSGGWFVQPELLYSSQGGKVEDESLVLGYLKMPVYVGYKIRTDNKASVILGLGKYFAGGVHGDDEAFEYAFRKFDVGVSGFVGIQIQKTQIMVSYDYGYWDIMKMEEWHAAKLLDSSLPNICNRTLKISIAQFF